MITIGLDPRTQLLMEQMLAGKKCCECNQPANRMKRTRLKKGDKIVKGKKRDDSYMEDRFYCFSCFADRYGNQQIELIPKKLHHAGKTKDK